MSYIADQFQSVLLRPRRAIGTIVPHVVVEEAGSDELELTQHPVEAGAAITDHAYIKPAELRMVCGWSPGKSILPGLLSVVPGVSTGLVEAFGSGGQSDYITRVYAELLALQRSRAPLTVTTGKRQYTNMLIVGLSQTTDRRTEYALMVEASLRQVLTVRSRAATLAETASQAQPQRTGSPADAGTVTPRAADQSLLPMVEGG